MTNIIALILKGISGGFFIEKVRRKRLYKNGDGGNDNGAYINYLHYLCLMIKRVNATYYRFEPLKFTPVYGIPIAPPEKKYWGFYNQNEGIFMYDMILEGGERLVAAGCMYNLVFKSGLQSSHFDHYTKGVFPDWYKRFNRVYPDAGLQSNSQMYKLFRDNNEPIGNFFRWYAWQFLPKVSHKRIIYTDEFPIRRKKAVEWHLYGKTVKEKRRFKSYALKN